MSHFAAMLEHLGAQMSVVKSQEPLVQCASPHLGRPGASKRSSRLDGVLILLLRAILVSGPIRPFDLGNLGPNVSLGGGEGEVNLYGEENVIGFLTRHGPKARRIQKWWAQPCRGAPYIPE